MLESTEDGVWGREMVEFGRPNMFLESLGPALSHGGIFGTQLGHLRGKMTPTRFWGSGGVSRGGLRRLEIGFRGPVMADWDI